MFYNVHKPLICHHPFMLCMDGGRVCTVLECWQLKSQELSVKHTVFSISMYYDCCVLLLCSNHLAAGNTAAGWRNQPGGGKKEGSLILLTALITIICRCKARLEKWLPVSHFCKFHLSKQRFLEPGVNIFGFPGTALPGLGAFEAIPISGQTRYCGNSHHILKEKSQTSEQCLHYVCSTFNRCLSDSIVFPASRAQGVLQALHNSGLNLRMLNVSYHKPRDFTQYNCD